MIENNTIHITDTICIGSYEIVIDIIPKMKLIKLISYIDNLWDNKI